MTDEDQIERLLRARPTTDARYQPELAELLEADRRAPVVGTLRWRYGNPGLARLLPLVLLGAAILVAATVLLAGGVPPNRLVVVEPSQLTASQKPVRDFPAEGVTAILARFKASHWAATPDVILDVAIQGDDGYWAATSGVNAATVAGQGTYPGQTAVRIGGAGHVLVAILALWLADQGRLDLDAPISQYISVWPDGETITVRDLVDGSSGVAPFGEPVEDLARLVAAEPDRAWTAADALRIAREKTPRFMPGAKHEPVDTEDVLLVSIIEGVTGSSFDDAIHELFLSAHPPPPDVVGPGLWEEPDPDTGLWDPTASGTLTQVVDLPPGVLAVLGRARGLTFQVANLATMTTAFHTDPFLLSAATRAMVNKSIDEGGFGGAAMCPCAGLVKNGIGQVGHTGPYTAVTVYVPSERLTISLVANAPVSDDDLQALLQELHDLAWPAIH
jgi:D-alanyl-D-alanine carboxypeptidase